MEKNLKKAREIRKIGCPIKSTRMYGAAIENACKHIYEFHYTCSCGEVTKFPRKLNLTAPMRASLRNCNGGENPKWKLKIRKMKSLKK